MRIVGMLALLAGLVFVRPALAVEDCEFIRTPEGCLVCNLYHESRSESPEGIMSVAQVTLNRVESPNYPDTICGVVWEKRFSEKHDEWIPQFEWTLDGESDRMTETNAVKRLRKLAHLIMVARELEVDHTLINIPRTTMWFLHEDLKPGWTRNLVEVAIIGDHVFYRK